MEPQLLKFFAINVPAIELVLRGSALYLLLFLLFRFVVPREVGSFGIADLLVLVLIAESAHNAMSGDFTTIPEGAVLIGTILGWHVLSDWLGFRLRRSAALVEPSEPQRRDLDRPSGIAAP